MCTCVPHFGLLVASLWLLARILTILHQAYAFFAQSGVQCIKHNMNIELPIHYTVCSYCMHLNMTAAIATGDTHYPGCRHCMKKALTGSPGTGIHWLTTSNTISQDVWSLTVMKHWPQHVQASILSSNSETSHKNRIQMKHRTCCNTTVTYSGQC